MDRYWTWVSIVDVLFYHRGLFFAVCIGMLKMILPSQVTSQVGKMYIAVCYLEYYLFDVQALKNKIGQLFLKIPRHNSKNMTSGRSCIHERK